ncbi:MAG: hypothetical protein H7Y28_05400 [Rhodoferax sp.]|nr:hypothetical protein [Rhodoferax sp.]
MQSETYLPILKRAGLVLLNVGLLDIGVMIYCIVNAISYTSSFNIFAVVGGVFLMRGNLIAASLVRWLSLFIAAALISVVLVSPALQPLGLIFTEFKLNPVSTMLGLGLFAGAMVLLVWLSRQLGSPQVLAARAAAGRKVRNPTLPVGLGVGLALVLAVVSLWVQRSDAAAKAIQAAKAMHGASYEYHVSSLNYRNTNEGTFVSGVVTVWNVHEVKNVPFQWHD